MWRELVYYKTEKILKIDKKKWLKLCDLLLLSCEYEESDETSQVGETQSWLDNYFHDYMRREADVDTLSQSQPFIDDTGHYLQLDNFLKHLGNIHVNVTRAPLANRLKVCGWSAITLHRADDKKRSITKRYWHKAPAEE